MNKSLSAAIIVVVLLAGAGGAYAFYKKADTKTDQAINGSNANQQMAEQSNNATKQTEDTAPPSAKQLNQVLIENFTFSPSSITVKKGTTVTWTNNDSAGHNAFSKQDGGPKGPILKKGETYSFTFDKTGVFNYMCEPHPHMKGTVTVTD